MPYTNCSACGAKALVGATRCPRCQAPFVSYEMNGERVPTVNCPNCGVQRPVAIGVCPNCLMSNGPSGARLTRGLVRAALGIAVILVIGYLISRGVEGRQDGAPAAAQVPADTSDLSAVAANDSTATTTGMTPTASDSTPKAPSATESRVAVTSPEASLAQPAPSPAPTPTASTAKSNATLDPAMMPPKPAKPPTVAVPDTGRWEYAVAITWVRVRSGPSRESEVLRMVDSAQRVRLGPPLNGWRSVRVGVDRGWVDPRLFVVQAERP